MVLVNQFTLLNDGKSFVIHPASHESSQVLLDDKNWPDEIKQELELQPPPKMGAKVAQKSVEYDNIAKRVDSFHHRWRN